MKRFGIALFALGILAVLLLPGMSQPPGDKGPKKDKKGPPYELGKVLPPFVREGLDLTKEQEDAIGELEKEVRTKLMRILTAAQVERIKELKGPKGTPKDLDGDQPPPKKGKDNAPAGDRPESLRVDLQEPPAGLIKNSRFTQPSSDAKVPAHFSLSGNVAWVPCGDAHEFADQGIAFYSAKGGERSGSVMQSVTGFKGGVGKWFRFNFRGLAEPNFAAEKLFMRVDYFGKNGANSLDGVTHNIYPLVERYRKELAQNGKYHKNGGSVWKTFTLEFRLPFAEIDTLNLAVGFKHGAAVTDKGSEFYVTEFSLTPIPPPEDAPKVVKTEKRAVPSLKSLMRLGGRWYYDPETPLKERPSALIVTVKNAHRLYYLDNQLSNPFAENMTAWLRKGHLDRLGKLVEEDRFVPDNVVLEFRDGKDLVVHTRNLPNHPTAKFPDRSSNPNYIQEKDRTYYLPLDPAKNPRAVAMDRTNSNRALPMGPIGVAINGVAFFNPFDMGNEDAVDMMDRCCGHPAPDYLYHYHKYPVCVKSPFVDDGAGHSPLIGFALDGFPIYGPYVAKGLMAKDDQENPLNEFNMRHDDERGWHYHVTPGRYPYVIGGFWGEVDVRNLRPKKGPR